MPLPHSLTDLPLEIETYLPYLVNRVALALMSYSAPEFEKNGLTVPQWRILLALRQYGERRVGDLVKLTAIEPPTLSRLLGMLEERGLLERRRVQPDTRGVAVSLLPAGRHVFEETIESALEAEAMLTEGFTHAERLRLQSYLTRMFDNVAGRLDGRS